MVALAFIAAGALGLRVPDLGNRPMHADESVHALKLRELWEKGTYRYNPNEFHGPTLYYATLPVLYLHGRRSFGEVTEGDLRIPPAVAGAAMVLLPALLADGLGWPAVLIAAALMAVSPSLVFYSRYTIQEMLLVFFTLAAVASAWRWARRRNVAWAGTLGLFAGLMLATKETAAVSLVVSLAALAVARRWGCPARECCQAVGRGAAYHAEGRDDEATVAHGGLMHRAGGGPGDAVPQDGSGRVSGKARGRLLLAGVVAAATVALFLSGFGCHPGAPVDLLRSYLLWGERAGGTDLHRHPWHYYLGLVGWARRGGPVWSEAFTLALAVVGVGAACRRPARRGVSAGGSVGAAAAVDLGLARFLVLYTLGLLAAYSLIPYKTPWCVAGVVQGLALLAGLGGAALLRAAPGRLGRAGVGVALLAGVIHLGWQAYRASYVYAADGRNPYVYSETAPDVLDLADQIEGLMGAMPTGEGFVVQVISEDDYCWPLPWYLRRVPNVGYWTGVPDDLPAPVVLASSAFGKELSRRLGGTHTAAGYYGLRSRLIYQVWVRKDLWQAYLRMPRRVEPGE